MTIPRIELSGIYQEKAERDYVMHLGEWRYKKQVTGPELIKLLENYITVNHRRIEVCRKDPELLTEVAWRTRCVVLAMERIRGLKNGKRK